LRAADLFPLDLQPARGLVDDEDLCNGPTRESKWNSVIACGGVSRDMDIALDKTNGVTLTELLRENRAE
jgi:hypothetical protein